MRVARFGSMDIPTAVSLLAAAGLAYSAWLTSIVFCASNDCWSLLIASASFRHHVATATTLDGLCDAGHVPIMFYRSKRL
jgi:hypothetical protein